MSKVLALLSVILVVQIMQSVLLAQDGKVTPLSISDHNHEYLAKILTRLKKLDASAGVDITSVSFPRGTKLTRDDLNLLPRSVAFLELRGTTFLEDDLGCLDNQVAMQMLDLTATSVTDRVFQRLERALLLERLLLDDTAVTGEGLIDIRNLSLRDLYLGGTKMTKAGFRMLQLFPNLRSLRLSRTDFEQEDAVQLRHFQKLQFLDLSDTKVQSLSDLCASDSQKTIAHLYLSNTDVGDGLMNNLSGCEQLSSLAINGTAVTLDGVKLLLDPLKYGKLNQIVLDPDQINDEVTEEFKDMFPGITIRIVERQAKDRR